MVITTFSVVASESSKQKMDVLTLQNDMVFQGKIVRIKNCTVLFKAEGRKYLVPANDIFSLQFGDLNSRAYRDYVGLDEDNKCLNGRLDAENFHGKKGGHFALGFFFGPFAMIGTAIANPMPHKGKNTFYMSKNKDQFNDPEYLSCYRTKAKSQLLLMEAAGWGTSILLLLL